MKHQKRLTNLKGQVFLGRIIGKSKITLTNTMPYKHFNLKQRNQLAILLRMRVRKKEIARLLGKSRTTIWREHKRGKGINGKYYVRKAQKQSKKSRIRANSRFRKIGNNKDLKEYIIQKIKMYWSPEQTAGRWNKNHREEHIGKDTIYRFIYNERKDLVKYLRCQKGKYRRRYGTRIREKERERLKKRRIDERPEEVNLRVRIGHWEGDTILGKDKEHILTHVERKSGFILADKLGRATAEATKEKTIERFKKIDRDKRLTITYDNGSSFSEHELTEKTIGATIYFAYPYHSWERGCNENANGLLRQFFPKKSNFATVNQKEIDRVVKLLNHRPRKRLSYNTPYEVFYEKN